MSEMGQTDQSDDSDQMGDDDQGDPGDPGDQGAPRDQADRAELTGHSGRPEDADLAVPTPADDAEPAQRDESSNPTPDEVKGEGSALQERLEREGDVAADYLEELLDIADLDGDLDMDVEA